MRVFRVAANCYDSDIWVLGKVFLTSWPLWAKLAQNFISNPPHKDFFTKFLSGLVTSHMLMRVDFLNIESTHKYVGEMMSKIRQWMGTLTWNPLRLGGQLQSVPWKKTPACWTGVDRLWSASVVLQSCRMGKKGVFVQHQIGSHSAISHMKASEWLSFNRHLHSGINAEGKEQNSESTPKLDL